jgi:hypothetical protein
MSAGRKPNLIRVQYRERYGLSKKQAHDIDEELFEKLERCADDAARRLLLGVSRKEAA